VCGALSDCVHEQVAKRIANVRKEGIFMLQAFLSEKKEEGKNYEKAV